MKLIIAIVNKDDTPRVTEALTKAGFFFTRIATSGGFLRTGNTTLLIGTEDHVLDKCIRVIRDHCATRNVTVPVGTGDEEFDLFGMSAEKEITVGGAVVFVTNIERTEKM